MRRALLTVILPICMATCAAAQQTPPADRTEVDPTERAQRFAEGMLGRFDTNKDGVLKQDEWTLPALLNEQTDLNRDGVITKDELVDRMRSISVRATSRVQPAEAAPSSAAPSQVSRVVVRGESAGRSESNSLTPNREAASEAQRRAAVPEFTPIEGPVERLLIFARHAPVRDLADALNQHFQASAEPSARVVAVPTSNSLLISATSDMLPRVRDLVEQLDRAPAMISLQVVVVEQQRHEPAAVSGAPTRPTAQQSTEDDLRSGPADEVLAKIQQWETQGKLSVLHRLQMATLDNQRAMVQIGQNKPVVEGVQWGGSRGESRNVRQQNVGMLVTATPRASADGDIVVELQFEKSDVMAHPSDPSLGTTSTGEKIPSMRTVTSTARSTLTIPRGEAVVLADVRTTGASEQNRLLLAVTASVSGAAGKNGD